MLVFFFIITNLDRKLLIPFFFVTPINLSMMPSTLAKQTLTRPDELGSPCLWQVYQHHHGNPVQGTVVSVCHVSSPTIFTQSQGGSLHQDGHSNIPIVGKKTPLPNHHIWGTCYPIDIQGHQTWGSVFGPLKYVIQTHTKPEDVSAWKSRVRFYRSVHHNISHTSLAGGFRYFLFVIPTWGKFRFWLPSLKLIRHSP